VSCASAVFCEAVGSHPDRSGLATVSLAEVWNGATWKIQKTPNPARAAGGLRMTLAGVSCVSARFCEAVGSSSRRLNAEKRDASMEFANNPKTLAEAWNGHTWRLQHPVMPPGATFNALASVSCVSTMFCEAVGTHFDSAGNQVDLAEMWNGTSWQLQAIPGTSVQPMSVSCVTTSFCMEANGFGQVAIWNGSSWSAGPAVTGFSPVTGVSCVSASFCEAVGSGPSGDNAAVWNGTTWTAQPTPGPASSFLSAVSCAAADSCEAVGSSANSVFQEVTFAEVWNGSAWTTQPIPNPKASQGSFLRAVSCTSASSCTAVGDYQYFGGSFSNTLAEVWDGSKWSLRFSPNHPYAGHNTLNGVSCGASSVCTAVGQSQDIDWTEATLIDTGD